MKARIILLTSTICLTLAIFGAAPVSVAAKTTGFTGAWTFVNWVDVAGYPKCMGHPELNPYVDACPTAIHDLADTYWHLDASDPRFSGTYVLRTTCNWRKEPFVAGPCKGTWTVDIDNDQKPEWEGAWAFGSNWGLSGHGLDEFAGLNVSLKIHAIAFPDYIADGQVTGK